MIKTAGLRDRTRAHRAASRIRRDGGRGSLATHCMAQGLRRKQAQSVSGTLRNKAAELGIEGEPHLFYVKGEVREGSLYTQEEVAQMALVYRPRLFLYREAAEYLRAID